MYTIYTLSSDELRRIVCLDLFPRKHEEWVGWWSQVTTKAPAHPWCQTKYPVQCIIPASGYGWWSLSYGESTRYRNEGLALGSGIILQCGINIKTTALIKQLHEKFIPDKSGGCWSWYHCLHVVLFTYIEIFDTKTTINRWKVNWLIWTKFNVVCNG